MKNWYKTAKETVELTDEEFDELARSKWTYIDDSSCIDAIAYHEPLRFLDVMIKGREYTFMDVPPEVYEAFMKATSKGRFFNDIIKPRYEGKND